MKRGKKYAEAAKAVDRTNLYDPAEAISLVKKTAVAKFDETIEAHIRTGCDGRHAEQQIRGAVVLPHGTGKTVRVLVFAKNAKADEAQAAGADFVGAEDLIPKIQNEGWLDFDVVVATPDMMGFPSTRRGFFFSYTFPKPKTPVSKIRHTRTATTKHFLFLNTALSFLFSILYNYFL